MTTIKTNEGFRVVSKNPIYHSKVNLKCAVNSLGEAVIDLESIELDPNLKLGADDEKEIAETLTNIKEYIKVIESKIK